MKRYDSYTIKNELLERLQANKDWKAISGNSVINSLLDAFAEHTAEQARYSEMLFLESRWDTSQDSKQISSLANIIGYEAKRKVSASGTIYFSSSNAIHEVGRTISMKNFNALNLEWDKSLLKVDTNKNDTVIDSLGNSYVFTSSNPLESGAYYSSNSVIEGVRKAIKIPASIVRDVAKKSKLNPYAYVPIKISNMEDAGTTQTASFFKVLVDGTKEYRVVDSLLLSEGSDRDVEVIPDLYTKDMYYLKFNTDPSRGEVLNFSKAASGFDYIEIQYVESRGAEGNIPTAFQKFTITTASGALLYGIALDPITGGNDEEDISTVKEKAPEHYLKTYTTATKDAYQEAIKKIDFGSQVYASNVKIFAGKDIEDNPVVFASLISPELESSIEEGEITENRVNSILNLSLNSFKAPSDNLKYVSPNYERISIGVQCTVPRGAVDNTATLATEIQATIDGLYGMKSSLDFGKDLYDADIIKTIKEQEPAILSIKTELEAVERLDWVRATRQTPRGNGEASIKTIRVPFDFSKIFEGSRYTFKNYTNGADYSLRLDFLVKGSSSIVNTYHSTLIVNESEGRTMEEFVIIKDTNSIWEEDGVLVVPFSSYSFLDSDSNFIVDEVDETNLKQYAFLNKILTDDDYNTLITDSSVEQLVEGIPGYMSDILIYYSGDNDISGRIGTGYVEMGVDSIYNILQIYALKDSILAAELAKYPLANLKCSTDEADMLGFITDILTPYVEIYSSSRLYEKDLMINDQSYDPSAVIFVESDDTSSSTTNLKEDKLSRFLSVECDTV